MPCNEQLHSLHTLPSAHHKFASIIMHSCSICFASLIMQGCSACFASLTLSLPQPVCVRARIQSRQKIQILGAYLFLQSEREGGRAFCSVCMPFSHHIFHMVIGKHQCTQKMHKIRCTICMYLVQVY